MSDGSPLRILVAEDDFTSRRMLTALLERCGHDVEAVADGDAAWAALQVADAPPLAILDWLMPGLDGVEVIRRLRAVDAAEPPYLLVLTTRDTKEDVITALDAGADDYMVKPFDHGELRARIRVGERMLAMRARLAVQVRKLRDAAQHIHVLQEILPICSICKKIRDDHGYWNQVEAYLADHVGTSFSHGICPDCMREHYPGLNDETD